jgi:acyl-homoserine lactone acylase PvdQ
MVGRTLGFRARARADRRRRLHRETRRLLRALPPFACATGPASGTSSTWAIRTRRGFILPGGESGFAAGAHAFDQLPPWLTGGLAPIPCSGATSRRRGG